MAIDPSYPFAVLVEETGDWAYADDSSAIIAAGRQLLEDARESGHRSPAANFYARGLLVRYRVTRTDLSDLNKRCWCGRMALKTVDDFAFCSDQHRTLWDDMSTETKARVSVARFIALYGHA